MKKEDLTKEFIHSPNTKKALEDVFKKYVIQVSVEDAFVVIERLLNKELEYDELTAEFEETLDVDFDTAFEVTLVVKDLLVEYQKREKKFKDVEKKEIQEKGSDAGKFLNTLLEAAGIKANSVIFHRFSTAVQSYIRDIRKESELLNALTRNEKVGGIGLNEKTAQEVLKQLKTKKKELHETKTDIDAFFGVDKSNQPSEAVEAEIDVTSSVVAKQDAKPKANTFVAAGETTIKDLLKEKGMPLDKLGEPAAGKADKDGEKVDDNKSKDEKVDSKNIKDFRDAFEKTESMLEATPEISSPQAKKEIPSHDDMETHVHGDIQHDTMSGDGPGAVINSSIHTKETKTNDRPSEPDKITHSTQPATQTPPVTKPSTIDSESEVKHDIMPKAQPVTSPKSGERPKMEDIKYTPRVYGPIDELKNLDIKNFRRLGDTPEKAVNKIREKMNLFQEESYAEKVEAMKALESSPLYQKYSSIIQRSFTQSKPAAAVITPEDGITIDEFNALMKLNNELTK